MANLTKYEQDVMNGTDAWGKGLIAYRHGHMEWLTTDELNHIIATKAEKDFIAEMSDSYATTRAEKKNNAAIYRAAMQQVA